MKKVIDKSDSRGHSLYDWLDSHHTFSFDEYYNPRRMNFGALRVLNDDRVAPGKGFGTHPHKNMEIISIPLKGKLKHGDNHQNSRIIIPGDIQTMSAGTGIYHSEMNGSDTEAVEFLQIWLPLALFDRDRIHLRLIRDLFQFGQRPRVFLPQHIHCRVLLCAVF